MVPTVYLVCGVSGSGKSWVCRQLAQKFHYVPHDEHYKDHAEVVVRFAIETKQPVITECPFGERVLRHNITERGGVVIPVFVIEDPELVAQRYYDRERKELPKNAYTRATTIKNRAQEWNAFSGTSTEVLEYLRNV